MSSETGKPIPSIRRMMTPSARLRAPMRRVVLSIKNILAWSEDNSFLPFEDDRRGNEYRDRCQDLEDSLSQYDMEVYVFD